MCSSHCVVVRSLLFSLQKQMRHQFRCAPQLPLCATPHTYCLLVFDWAATRSDTLHLSLQLSTLAVTLHCTSQRNIHDVSMYAYTLRAKMRLSGPVLAASLPSSNTTAFVRPPYPRVQNASFANCLSVDESQEGFEFALLSPGRSVWWDSPHTVTIIGLLT